MIYHCHAQPKLKAVVSNDRGFTEHLSTLLSFDVTVFFSKVHCLLQSFTSSLSACCCSCVPARHVKRCEKKIKETCCLDLFSFSAFSTVSPCFSEYKPTLWEHGAMMCHECVALCGSWHAKGCLCSASLSSKVFFSKDSWRVFQSMSEPLTKARPNLVPQCITADAPLISACRWTNPTIFSSTGPRILILRHREQRCALAKRSCKWSWRCRAVPHCVTPPGEHGLACWSSPWLRSIWLTATYRSQASTYRALCVCLGSGSSLPPTTPQEYCLSKAGDHTEMLVCKYKHCSSRPKKTEDRAIIISGRFMASPSLLSRWAALAWRNTCTCRHGRTGEMDKQIKGLWHSNGTWNWKHSQRLQKLPQKDSTSFQDVEIATGVKRACVASSFSNTQASQAVETQTGIRVRSAASACISLGVVLLCPSMCFYVLLSQRLSHFSASFLLICGHQKQTFYRFF